MKAWILFSIVPMTAFCGQMEEEFFDFVDSGNDLLLHIVYDLDEEKNLKSKNKNEIIDVQGLSLLEIDENDESLLPWSAEEFSSDLSILIEQKKHKSQEDYDDTFNYEISTRPEQVRLEPTFEKVPESKRQLFGKPKRAFSN